MPLARCPDMPLFPNRFQRLRRHLGLGLALGAVLSQAPALAADAAARIALRISTPAVADDWHARMWTVFKDSIDRAAPGEFDVQIHLNATLFKQGAEITAMNRGNLELATVSAFDIAKQVPEFSIFTAGYVIRDVAHQRKVLGGPIGESFYRTVSERMGLRILSPIYLGTRHLGLRTNKPVRTPADLKGVKLRMPATREWLFLGSALGASAMPLALGEVYLGLKTGTIDGEDNPLPTVRAAKFNEVLQQIVLTGHLVDALFITIPERLWLKLRPAQQIRLREAAAAAAAFNDENRLREESQLQDQFRKQGLTLTTPDVDAFRKRVLEVYAGSETARTWPKGLLERIQDTR
jgi:TRAP-type transport system periplasmic protein